MGFSTFAILQANSPKPWTLDKNKLTALFKTELPFAFRSSPKRAVRWVDKAEFASVIQDAATASSSIIDETMAMLNEQDTLDNVKAKLKPFNVDERNPTIQNLPKVRSVNFAKYAERETYR